MESVPGLSGIHSPGAPNFTEKAQALLALSEGRRYLHVKKIDGEEHYRVDSHRRHSLSHRKVAALAQATLGEVTAPENRKKIVVAIATITQRLKTEVSKQNIFKRIFAKLFKSNRKAKACREFEKILHIDSLSSEQKRAMLHVIKNNPDVDWEYNLGFLERNQSLFDSEKKDALIDKIITTPREGVRQLHKTVFSKKYSHELSGYETVRNRLLEKIVSTMDKINWERILPELSEGKTFEELSAHEFTIGSPGMMATEYMAENPDTPWEEVMFNLRGKTSPEKKTAIEIIAGNPEILNSQNWQRIENLLPELSKMQTNDQQMIIENIAEKPNIPWKILLPDLIEMPLFEQGELIESIIESSHILWEEVVLNLRGMNSSYKGAMIQVLIDSQKIASFQDWARIKNLTSELSDMPVYSKLTVLNAIIKNPDTPWEEVMLKLRGINSSYRGAMIEVLINSQKIASFQDWTRIKNLTSELGEMEFYSKLDVLKTIVRNPDRPWEILPNLTDRSSSEKKTAIEIIASNPEILNSQNWQRIENLLPELSEMLIDDRDAIVKDITRSSNIPWGALVPKLSEIGFLSRPSNVIKNITKNPNIQWEMLLPWLRGMKSEIIENIAKSPNTPWGALLPELKDMNSFEQKIMLEMVDGSPDTPWEEVMLKLRGMNSFYKVAMIKMLFDNGKIASFQDWARIKNLTSELGEMELYFKLDVLKTIVRNPDRPWEEMLPELKGMNSFEQKLIIEMIAGSPDTPWEEVLSDLNKLDRVLGDKLAIREKLILLQQMYFYVPKVFKALFLNKLAEIFISSEILNPFSLVIDVFRDSLELREAGKAFLTEKLNRETDEVKAREIAKQVLNSQDWLGLTEEDPLLYRAIVLHAQLQQTKNNPYFVYGKLLKLSEQDFPDIKLPQQEINGKKVALVPRNWKPILTEGSPILFRDINRERGLNFLRGLFESFKARYNFANPEEKRALDEELRPFIQLAHAGDFNGLYEQAMDLLSNSNFTRFFEAEGAADARAPRELAYLSKILEYIDDQEVALPTEEEKKAIELLKEMPFPELPEALSEQERVLLSLQLVVQGCSTGVRDGIKHFYRDLPGEYHYDMQGSMESVDEKEEMAKKQVYNVLSNATDELINNPQLLQDLAETYEVPHQKTYLQNILSLSLGIQEKPELDRHSGCISNRFFNMSFEDVLRQAFDRKYIKPSDLIEKFREGFNKIELKQKNHLLNVMRSKMDPPLKQSDLGDPPDIKYDDEYVDFELTTEGALRVLKGYGVLTVADQEGSNAGEGPSS